MGRSPWSGEAERRAATASGMLANVVLDPRPLTRDRCHTFGKSGRLIAHRSAIGSIMLGLSLEHRRADDVRLDHVPQ